MAEPADILFLVHRAPWPPDRGDRIRSWHIAQALAQIGRLHVAALCDNADDERVAREKLAPMCATLWLGVRRRSRAAATLHALATGMPASVSAFADAAMARHVSGLIRHGPISHIVGFSGQTGQYLPARSAFSGPVVMDFVDVDSAKFAAYGEGERNPLLARLYAREGRVLGAYERQIAHRVDASLFVSAAEAALFRDGGDVGPAPVLALENGIDTLRFDPDGDWTPLAPADRPAGMLSVFTGQMDYPPNVAAVSHFAHDILPRLRRDRPDAGFAIVGRSPSDAVRRLAALPGVIVTGEVPDTRPWIAAADAIVAPLDVARGVQNKLLEAMAMARPVVASPAAAQGIDAVVGQELLVADGPIETAAALNALFDDPAHSTAIGAAARARMIARYGWAATLAPLAGILGLSAEPV